YDPCIAMMVLPKNPLSMPEHGGWQINEEPLQFVADNQLKGLPNPGQALTFHLGPRASTEHWESGPEKLSDLVRGELRKRGKDLVIEDIQVHRWRYSQPSRLHDESFLVAKGVPNLVFAGDAFAGPKVEGAALSGLSAAQAMIS
ncbi:MAG: FAD-dependent oxidoreductase, partial [SAR324 cluster bacterium]|nr:FAD-dependent oxidoreductase [SAR324 cluster bacterium]